MILCHIWDKDPRIHTKLFLELFYLVISCTSFVCLGVTCSNVRDTIGCKTRETLQNVAIFFMKFTPEPINMPFSQFTPCPPESMLITPSSTIVISYLANIVQGRGGMLLYLGLGYSKFCQKTVKCLISFATDCAALLQSQLSSPRNNIYDHQGTLKKHFFFPCSVFLSMGNWCWLVIAM